MRLLSEKLNGRDPHRAGLALLQKLYGAPLPEIQRTPLGKPYFPGENLYFSISHTPRHAFCVLSQKEVGLDAEELDRDIKLALAEKILSETERKEYEQAEDKRLAAFACWTINYDLEDLP